MPDLGCPKLDVDATNGLELSREKILGWVREQLHDE